MSGAVASWGTCLTRISAEIKDDKRLVVVVVLLCIMSLVVLYVKKDSKKDFNKDYATENPNHYVLAISLAFLSKSWVDKHLDFFSILRNLNFLIKICFVKFQ